MSLQPTLELSKCLLASMRMCIGQQKFIISKSEFMPSEHLALSTILPISKWYLYPSSFSGQNSWSHHSFLPFFLVFLLKLKSEYIIPLLSV